MSNSAQIFLVLNLICFFPLSGKSQQQIDSSYKNAIKQIIEYNQVFDKTLAKGDTLVNRITDIPEKYIKVVDQKVTKYSQRLTSEAERTLEKLAKWELELKPIIEKANPETARQLFGPGKTTFATMLDKLREGKQLAQKGRTSYDEYRSKLTESLNLIHSEKEKFTQSTVQQLGSAQKHVDQLEQNIANTDAIEQFIKQRKKELLEQAIKYAANSRYIKKINKEAYYYVERLRNYKELFQDPKKVEELAIGILKKIPAFSNFLKGIGAGSAASGNVLDPASLGLQSNAVVESILKERLNLNSLKAVSAQVTNAAQDMQSLSAEAKKLKRKSKPEGFKINNQKSRTFWQRLDHDVNYQFAQSHAYLPSGIDLGLNIGYKLNDKSIIGVGLGYKMGYGSINKIKITHEGLVIRTKLDWKLKRNMYCTGGYEWSYIAGFTQEAAFRNFNKWQKSCLIGFTKEIPVRTSFSKTMRIQILYDAFYHNKIPVTKPFVFRVAYKF